MPVSSHRRRGASVFSVLGVGVVLSLAACAGNGPTATPNLRSQEAPGTAVGQTATRFGVDFSLLDVRCAPSASLESSHPGDVWVGFQLKIDNKTSSSLAGWDYGVGPAALSAHSAAGPGKETWMFDAFDQARNTYPADWEPLLDLSRGTIKPHSDPVFWVIFAVPTPQSGVTLVLHGSSADAQWVSACPTQ